MIDHSCIFCKIVKKEVPSKIVFEDTNNLAFEDIHPQAPVHVIIIPKSHVEKVSDLTATHGPMAGELIITAKKIAKERQIEETGYRIVINCGPDAGQAVGHLHAHLIGGRQLGWPPG